MLESNGATIGFAHTICNLPRGFNIGGYPTEPLVSTSVMWYHLNSDIIEHKEAPTLAEWEDLGLPMVEAEVDLAAGRQRPG